MPKLKILFLDMAMSFARLPFSTDLIIKMLLREIEAKLDLVILKGNFIILNHMQSQYSRPLASCNEEDLLLLHVITSHISKGHRLSTKYYK